MKNHNFEKLQVLLPILAYEMGSGGAYRLMPLSALTSVMEEHGIGFELDPEDRREEIAQRWECLSLDDNSINWYKFLSIQENDETSLQNLKKRLEMLDVESFECGYTRGYSLEVRSCAEKLIYELLKILEDRNELGMLEDENGYSYF